MALLTFMLGLAFMRNFWMLVASWGFLPCMFSLPYFGYLSVYNILCKYLLIVQEGLYVGHSH